MQLNQAYAAQHRADPAGPATQALGALIHEMSTHGEVMHFSRLERETTFTPGWARWLAAFAPHIFAFVFPLGLGRAIAAFGF